MRIESTFTFPAPVDEVFAALTDPDILRRAIPDCERLIQLGPPEADGAFHCDLRLRLGPGDDVYSANATLEPQSQPPHLGLDVHGQGPAGTFAVRGSLDLAGQDGRTIAAYVWDLDLPELPDEQRRALDEGAAARYADSAFAQLDAILRAGRAAGDTLADALPVLRADTARGKIVALPPEPPSGALTARLRPLLRAGVWAGAGLGAGLVAIAIAAAILRRWNVARPARPDDPR